ncbi:MAG: hypothetical protein GC137_10195 [Alphaproteobacteria bacterium]|nr:hypothetical protein [Alphaproteobacteria bacterium]
MKNTDDEMNQQQEAKLLAGLSHHQSPIAHLAVDLEFLGIVVHEDQFKAEFGPIGFYKRKLSPPSTLLVSQEQFAGMSISIIHDQNRHTYERRSDEWNKALFTVVACWKLFREGLVTAEDFDQPHQTPKSVLDDFLIDAHVSREQLEAAIFHFMDTRQHPNLKIDPEEEALLQKFLKSAHEATGNLKPHTVPAALQDYTREREDFFDDPPFENNDAAEDWKNGPDGP